MKRPAIDGQPFVPFVPLDAVHPVRVCSFEYYQAVSCQSDFAAGVVFILCLEA